HPDFGQCAGRTRSRREPPAAVRRSASVVTMMDRHRTSAGTQILIASELFLPDRVAGPAAVVVVDGAILAVWQDVDARTAPQRAARELPSAPVRVTDLRPWRV